MTLTRLQGRSLWLIPLLCCLGLAACGRTPSAPPPAPASTAAQPEAEDAHASPNEVRVDAGMMRDLRITTAAVESRRGGENVTLLGELAVDERAYAEVGTPVPARAERLLAQVGDRVRAGQVLLELQSADVGRARADYLSAVARATLADRALERTRAMAAERIAPQRQLQEAEAEAAGAHAAARAASAVLAAMGVSLPAETAPGADAPAVFPLRAPVSGTVIERAVVRGQLLDPAVPAFRIGDLSTLWLTVHAFERDAVRIAVAAPARVSFPALPDQEFAGTVSLVGWQVAKESRTVPVRIDVRNRGDVLKPGMSASASVPVGATGSPVLTVPVAAVQRVGERWCVFLPKAPGTFEIRPIGRGRDLGTEVEVLSGLAAGETIVVDGAFLLKSQAEKRDAGHGDH